MVQLPTELEHSPGLTTVSQIVAALQQIGFSVSGTMGDATVSTHATNIPTPSSTHAGTTNLPTPSITPSTPFHNFIEVHSDADDTDTDSGILAPHTDAAEGTNAALADSNVYTCPTCHTPLATPMLTMASAPVAPPTTPVTAIVDIIPAPATGATSSTNSSDTWYAITIGRNVGVFQGWLNVGPLVNGVTGFCVKKFPTRAAAMAAFQQAEGAGLVQVRQ